MMQAINIALCANEYSKTQIKVVEFEGSGTYRSNFRIPGHDCVTLISCFRSPATTTLIIKLKKKNVTKNILKEINLMEGV